MSVLLGQKARDRITGFTGVITGHVAYISGCNQVLLVPQVGKDGKLVDSQWFDEQRVEILKALRINLDNSRTPGPDLPAPKR